MSHKPAHGLYGVPVGKIIIGGEQIEKVAVVDGNGAQITSFGGGAGGGDGAIVDGVTSTIKATVLDLTNSNPLAVRLTDTNGDNLSSIPVTDNGGSLTVDSPQLPSALSADRFKVALVTSGGGDATPEVPVALADNMVNPTLSRFGAMAMVWDSAGTNWDRMSQPLTDTQLRASAVPVSGPLTDAQLRATSVQVDVADEAAREVGRVRLWDGVDEATIVPRDTLPASTDKALVVAPVIIRRPLYQVVTTEITSATTTGVKENLTLWHPNTLTKDVIILEIGVNVRVVQTAGTFAWELQFISAENGTPGGTTLTPQQLNRGDAASGLTVRQVVTGAPTVTGQIFQRASFPLPAAAAPFVGSSIDGFQIYGTDDEENGIWLRSGQSEGLRITQNVAATLTTAPIFTIYVRFVERS